MSKEKDHEPALEDLMRDAASALFRKGSAVLIVVADQPRHDSAVGSTKFIRRGRGPAYDLMIKHLEWEFGEADNEAEEIDPEDED